MKNFIEHVCNSSLFNNFELSFKMSFVISFFLSVIFPKLTAWYIDNIDYVQVALGVIAMDHLIGSIVHYYFKYDWDWKKNILGFSIKLSMVFCIGYLMEAIATITRDSDYIYTYIKMAGRTIVVLYPGMSLWDNVRVITKGKFPPITFTKKMRASYESGDLTKLKEENNQENNQEIQG